MSVELGGFRELQTGLDAGQIAVLVDTRDDQVEETATSGLILHHPELQRAQRQRQEAGNKSFFRIGPELVERLQQMCELHARNDGQASRADLVNSIDLTYRDPIAREGSSPVMAAFEPVCIESRPQEVRNTGWVVIIQETP